MHTRQGQSGGGSGADPLDLPLLDSRGFALSVLDSFNVSDQAFKTSRMNSKVGDLCMCYEIIREYRRGGVYTLPYKAIQQKGQDETRPLHHKPVYTTAKSGFNPLPVSIRIALDVDWVQSRLAAFTLKANLD